MQNRTLHAAMPNMGGMPSSGPRRDQTFYFFGGGGGGAALCERPHFTGDDRESPSLLPATPRFERRVIGTTESPSRTQRQAFDHKASYRVEFLALSGNDTEDRRVRESGGRERKQLFGVDPALGIMTWQIADVGPG